MGIGTFIDAWEDTAERLVELGHSLAADDWARPTDLPGWTVKDIFAHLAAVESELSGQPVPEVALPEHLPHVRNAFGQQMERGIEHRRNRPGAEIIAEFTRCVAVRSAELRANPPNDPKAPAVRAPGGEQWTWEVLLRNRVIDLWMHEQDIRRAVDRPGGLDTAGARVTLSSFAAALPYVLGKKVRPPAGTTAVWQVTGPFASTIAATMGADGRAAVLPEPPANPDLHLTMDAETLAILGGGRRLPAAAAVRVQGDNELAARVLAAMNVTF